MTTYSQIATNKRRTVVLISGFVVLLLLLGWAFGQWTESGYSGIVLAALVALAMTAFTYFSGDKVALWSAGAVPVAQGSNPYLERMVENLCIAVGLPKPRLYIIPDPAINAFATGRDPEHASVAVSAGALEKLENEELEGVLAHELSHVKNYDTRLMAVVMVLVSTIVLLSDWFWRFSFFGGRRRGGRDSGAGSVLMLVGLVLLILSPLIAQLVQLAVSRKRELLADASGALLTRYPDGLARALEKISAEGARMRSASNATAHLYFSNPFGKTARGLSRLFMTHPPIEERVAALRAMGSPNSEGKPL
jgi:heat shock protein HtpX